MIFFDGGSSSLHGVSEALDDFSSWSGLHMNREKTQLFHAGVNQIESDVMTNYGFTSGSLPIRYLGLPLMSRRLKISEYDPLLDNISSKFRSWSIRSLSFAGRLQLIASVISGTVCFWISTFLLPLGCIKKIEALCSKFLWSGSIEKRNAAKVAWSQVCLPKDEGGLGLRRFSIWNKTLCLRFIWLLFSGSSSLWVSWQKYHHLATKTFWEIEVSSSFSWTWNTLIALKPLAARFLRSVVGNGREASFWMDPWTPLGPLINALGNNGPRDLRIPLRAKVAEACNEEGWRIPSPRSEAQLDLHTHLTTIALPSSSSASDHYTWVTNNVHKNSFSSVLTWDELRPRESIKSWSKLVWFKGKVPKHAFNMWISHLNRLPTRVRLAAWGLNVTTECCLCGSWEETRDHVLLSCIFSAEIWRLVFIRLDRSQHMFRSWSELLSWTSDKSIASPIVLRCMAVQATIYHIWKQRNNLLHNSQMIPAAVVFKEIDRVLINAILGRRRKKGFDGLLSIWIR